MYKALLVPIPNKTTSREITPPYGCRSSAKWSFRAQYEFTLQIGEYYCSICLEPSKIFSDNGQFDSFLPQVIDAAQIIFNSGERLNIFGSNQFPFFENESKNIEGKPLDKLKTISLNLSEDTYNRLIAKCRKYNEVKLAFNRSLSYLFKLTHYGAQHDELARSCYGFLNDCLSKSIGMQYSSGKLGNYYSFRSKASSYDLAKRELYSVGAPELYELEPHIPSDIYKYLMPS